MTRFRATLLAALVWCGVVAAVATLVWVVISRAGAGVVPLAQPQADETGSLPVPKGDSDREGPVSPGATLRPRQSVSPSSGATPPVVPSSPTVSTQRRSWSGSAGHVVAECTGPSVSLVTAFPNAGWRYALLSTGPTSLAVRFGHGQEGDRSVTVTARCEAGAPRFSETRPEGGDD
jgi:hypothetical protein